MTDEITSCRRGIATHRQSLAFQGWMVKLPQVPSDIRNYWSPNEITSEKRAQKFHWHVTTQIWVVLLIGWNKFSANQKHYPDLGTDASSVSNVWWLRFSDVTLRENQWWNRKMLAVFSLDTNSDMAQGWRQNGCTCTYCCQLEECESAEWILLSG